MSAKIDAWMESQEPDAPAPATAAADARGVVVDAQAFATVRDMFSGGWCMKRNGEPCGESDCGQCDFDKWVDELITTAAPQPTAAGAVDLSALGEIRAVADTLSVCGSGTGATKMRQMATALRAACDALSTAAAPVRPSREAVEALVKTIRLGIPLPGCMTGPSEPCGACRTCKAWSACAAILALVPFADAPADAQAVEA